MKFVEIRACYKDGGELTRELFVIICGLNPDNRIACGEWMGYCLTNKYHFPFVLKNENELFFGWEENYYEMTDLKEKRILEGEYFTISNQPGDPEEFQSTYQITHVTPMVK